MCAYIPSYSAPFPVFQPAMRVIASITNALQPLVTTTVNHQYLVGTILRFDIPLLFGMEQLNQQTGTILTIPTPTTFTMSTSTVGMDPFTLPVSFPPSYQDAQTVPIGTENTNSVTAAVMNVLPHNGTT